MNHDVLDAQRIVFLRNAHEYLYIFIVARRGVELIELAGRCHELARQRTRDGMLCCLYIHQHGLWWPVVGIERTTAQKLVQPRPMGVRIVVARGMEAHPAASLLHVLLEGQPLCIAVG